MSASDRKFINSTLAEQGLGDDPSTHEVPDIFVELAATRIRSIESPKQRIIPGGSLASTTSEEVEFEECQFLSTDLSKTKWDKLRLHGVRIDSCDLANACWKNATLEKTEIRKCRGTGWQVLDSFGSDASFVGGKFNLAAFHGSKFRRCGWENCDLREANFEGVELVDVVFRNCDLRAARFPSCKFKNVDFRGSHLAGIQINSAALRGCRVEASQLADLANLFGLVVEPLEVNS